jgi:hypothetical protein
MDNQEEKRIVDPITETICDKHLGWKEARSSGVITDEMKNDMDKGHQPGNVISFSEHNICLKHDGGLILVKGRGENHSRIHKELNRMNSVNYAKLEAKKPIYFS